MAALGLILIIIGWATQLASCAKTKTSQLNKTFLSVYAIGILLLVIDAFSKGAGFRGFLNLVAGILAAITFFIVVEPKK